MEGGALRRHGAWGHRERPSGFGRTEGNEGSQEILLRLKIRPSFSSVKNLSGMSEARTFRSHATPKSKELASCLASSRITAFLFTVLTHANYGRGYGVGRGLGVTLGVGVGVTVGVGVGVVGVGVGVGVAGVGVGVGVPGVGVGVGLAHGGIS